MLSKSVTVKKQTNFNNVDHSFFLITCKTWNLCLYHVLPMHTTSLELSRIASSLEHRSGCLKTRIACLSVRSVVTSFSLFIL